jgi:hypothetical protein
MLASIKQLLLLPALSRGTIAELHARVHVALEISNSKLALAQRAWTH